MVKLLSENKILKEYSITKKFATAYSIKIGRRKG
jgi:hypothetical protein